MARVLLVAPPWGHVYGTYRSLSGRVNFHPPLGLCSLAAALGRAGHSVRVLDAEAQGLGDAALAALAGEERWDVIGLSATTPTYPTAVRLAAALRARYRGPIVLGGPHPTIVREEALAGAPEIDYLVCGEGERTLVELVAALEGGRPVHALRGIVLREGAGTCFTGPAGRIADLDALPFPDRSQLDPRRYLWSVPRRGLVPTTSVMYSRGCPFECAFCSQERMYGRVVHRRSVENMLAELEHLVATTPFRHLVFLDDTLTASRADLVALLEGMIARRLPFTFEGETRASLLDAELVRLLRAAGLVRMNVGIESGDPEMLERLKTGVTLEDVRTALRLLKAEGIETRGTVVIGAPYDRRASVLRTLRYVSDLDDLDQPYVCIAAPLPGTLMRAQALRGEGGARLLSDDYASLVRYGAAAMEVNDLTAAELVRLQAWGLRRAYARPRRLRYNLLRAGWRAGVLNGLAFARSMLGTALRRGAPGAPSPDRPDAA